MKENIFDFDVMARGSFIDNATGGSPFLVEAITIRLNHIAFNKYLDFDTYGPPESYATDEEWEQHKAKKEQDRAAWKKAIADKLELSEDKGSISITEALSEVFTVVRMERLP